MKKALAILLSVVVLLMGIPTITIAGVAESVSGDNVANGITVSLADWILSLGGGAYVDTNMIPVATHQATKEHYSNYFLDKAFDYTTDPSFETYWRTESGGDCSIIVDFGTVRSLSKIIFGLYSKSALFDGYPTKLRVAIAETEQDDFVDVGIASSQAGTDKMLFLFDKTVQAKRVKLTYEEYHRGHHAAGNIVFLQGDAVLDSVLRLFDDRERTVISPEFRSDRVLEKLMQEVNQHPYKNELIDQVERAQKILTGELDLDAFSYPVDVYQKTGPDDERIVLVFVADWYKLDQMENFKADIKPYIDQLFTYEPYKSYRHLFNVYLIETPSASDDINSALKNSYFGSHFGQERTMRLSTDGINAANRLLIDFREKYLDSGAVVHNFNVHVNATGYAGGGNLAVNEAKGSSIQNRSTPAGVMIHELCHSFGDLGDEYSYLTDIGLYTTSINLQENATSDNSKWKEFLGFKNITLVHIANQIYKPSTVCMMEDAYSPLCEVCQLGVVNEINQYLGDGAVGLYVASPQITTTVNSPIYFRTIVRNYGPSAKKLSLSLVVTDSNGNQVTQKTQDFTIASDTTQSVELEIADTLWTYGYQVEAKVLDEDGNVLADSATYQKDFGTVQIAYLIGTENEKTELVVRGTNVVTIPIQAGEVYRWSIPEIDGYRYTDTVGQNDFVVIKGNTVSVKHYYVPEKTEIQVQLIDDDGNPLGTVTRFAETGKPYEPTEAELPTIEGFQLVGPTTCIIPDGIREATVVCQYKSSVPPQKTVLSVEEVVVLDKVYDGQLSALVTHVVFGNLPSGVSLTREIDYTVSAQYDSANAGENKDVTVTVTLLNDAYIFEGDSSTESKTFLGAGAITKADPSLTVPREYTVADTDSAFTIFPTHKGEEAALWFSSSNEDVVTVSANGVVTPVGVGEAVVTVTLAETNNFHGASVPVTVKVVKGELSTISVLVDGIVMRMKNQYAAKVETILFFDPVQNKELVINRDYVVTLKRNGYVKGLYTKIVAQITITNLKYTFADGSTTQQVIFANHDVVSNKTIVSYVEESKRA